MIIGLDARMWGRGFGGFSRYLRELTSCLWRLDSQNHYVVFLTEPEFSRFEPSGKNVEKVRVGSPHYGFREQFFLPLELAGRGLDVMHFPNFNAPIFYPGKSVVTIHDLTSLFFPGPGYDSWFFRKAARLIFAGALKKSSRIIAVSRSTRNDILKNFKVPPEKISVIYEGAGQSRQISDLAILKKKYNIRKPYLFYSGSWRVHKNLPALVRAFSLLIKNPKNDLQLVLGGWADGDSRKAVLETAVAGAVADRLVIIEPPVLPDEEIFSLLGGAAAVVIPSLAEGFGFLGLEALGAGGIVAASRLGSLQEILGEAAVFFDPRNPDDMAEKIQRLISDEVLGQVLRGKSVDILSRYNWGKTARETLDIYQKAVLE